MRWRLGFAEACGRSSRNRLRLQAQRRQRGLEIVRERHEERAQVTPPPLFQPDGGEQGNAAGDRACRRASAPSNISIRATRPTCAASGPSSSPRCRAWLRPKISHHERQRDGEYHPRRPRPSVLPRRALHRSRRIHLARCGDERGRPRSPTSPRHVRAKRIPLRTTRAADRRRARSRHGRIARTIRCCRPEWHRGGAPAPMGAARSRRSIRVSRRQVVGRATQIHQPGACKTVACARPAPPSHSSHQPSSVMQDRRACRWDSHSAFRPDRRCPPGRPGP